MAATSGSAKEVAWSSSQDASANASSSIQATNSPAAAAIPKFRAAETLASEMDRILVNSAYGSRTSSVRSVQGPLTTITSKAGYDWYRRESRVDAAQSARL